MVEPKRSRQRCPMDKLSTKPATNTVIATVIHAIAITAALFLLSGGYFQGPGGGFNWRLNWKMSQLISLN